MAYLKILFRIWSNFFILYKIFKINLKYNNSVSDDKNYDILGKVISGAIKQVIHISKLIDLVIRKRCFRYN